MSILLRQIAQRIIRQVASDPEARAKLAKTAQGVMKEAAEISRHEDRAFAAGRALRRALNTQQKKSK